MHLHVFMIAGGAAFLVMLVPVFPRRSLINPLVLQLQILQRQVAMLLHVRTVNCEISSLVSHQFVCFDFQRQNDLLVDHLQRLVFPFCVFLFKIDIIRTNKLRFVTVTSFYVKP